MIAQIWERGDYLSSSGKKIFNKTVDIPMAVF